MTSYRRWYDVVSTSFTCLEGDLFLIIRLKIFKPRIVFRPKLWSPPPPPPPTQQTHITSKQRHINVGATSSRRIDVIWRCSNVLCLPGMCHNHWKCTACETRPKYKRCRILFIFKEIVNNYTNVSATSLSLSLYRRVCVFRSTFHSSDSMNNSYWVIDLIIKNWTNFSLLWFEISSIQWWSLYLKITFMQRIRAAKSSPQIFGNLVHILHAVWSVYS